MKKSRILGYVLTLAATLMVGSAMGQTVKGDDGRTAATSRFVKTERSIVTGKQIGRAHV